MKVSCVIPAHNEEGNLEPLVAQLVSALGAHGETRDYELVLVDDNSTDGTPRVVDQLAASNPRVVGVHRRSERRGFGYAIREGLSRATGDVIVPVMGDLSDDPRDIVAMVRRVEEGCDVVYGSRFGRGRRLRGYPRAKLLANRLFNGVVRLLLGIPHRDITNSFKAYRRPVIEAIGVENLRSTGFDISVELPLRAHLLGFRSGEVEVSWKDREWGEAKLKLRENATAYGLRLIRLFGAGAAMAFRDLGRGLVQGSPLHLLAALLLGAVLLVTLFSLSNFSGVFPLLLGLQWGYGALSVFSLLSAFLLRGWRWGVLLRAGGYPVERSTVQRAVFFGWFVNYLLPARLGDVGRGAVLKTAGGVPLGVGLATVVLERSLDMATLALLLGLLSLLFFPSMASSALLPVALLLSLALLVAPGFACLLGRGPIRLLGGRLPSAPRALDAWSSSLSRLFRSPQAWALCLLLSLPIWLLEVSSIYLAARAVGVGSPFLHVGYAGATAFVAQAMLVAPAGIGVHEATISGVLGRLGLPEPGGLSIALVDHLLRGVVVYFFGTLSVIHLAFQRRK